MPSHVRNLNGVIAYLPMYDFPSNSAAHKRLWQAFQESVPEAPELSSADNDLIADWLSPDLFLSQTCSLPFRAKLHGHVNLVASPNNNNEGCPDGYYNSVILARSGSAPHLPSNDFILAFNEPLSQSGWAAPASVGIVGKSRLQTGGHAASALAVKQGRADVAAVDALTWHFLCRDWDQADALQVVAKTPPTPTLPYITARTHNPKPLRNALNKAILELCAQDRETLQIFGLIGISADIYTQYPLPPTP